MSLQDEGGDGDETMSQLAEQAHGDAQLFEHNRRFQAAVLRTMEKQIAQMEEITSAKVRELEGSEQAREDLALSWGEMRKELGRMNKSHEKVHASLRDQTHANSTLTNENLHLKSELHTSNKTCAELNAELTRLRFDLSATREELHAGKKLHQLFSSDITMHRQLKENLAGEVRTLQTDVKKATGTNEELQTKLERAQAETLQVRSELAAQTNETKRAQAEVERVAHELGLLRASREVMTRQWEGALGAMHKRDQTMHVVGSAKQAAESELLVLRAAERSAATEAQTMRKQADARMMERDELAQRHQELMHAHDELLRAHHDLARQADLSAQQSSTHELALAQLTKTHALAQAENQRLKLKASQAVDATSLVQKRLEEQVALNQRIDASIASAENVAVARTSDENRALHQRCVQLEHEKQVEVNKRTEVVEQVKELARANASLHDEYNTTATNYETVIKDLKQMQISLEHMTYRANKAESESTALRTTKEEERRSEQVSLQGNIRALERELHHKADEVAKMNRAYVVAEEKVLEAHRLHSEISGKTERLKSELRKAEGVKDRLKHTIDDLARDNGEILKENNEHRLTVRKHQAAIAELASENQEMKGKLSEARFLAQERDEKHTVELAVVRAELVRSRTARVGVIDVLEGSEREKGLWERKHERVSLQLSSLQAEHGRLQQLCSTQQKQLKSLAKEQSLQEKQYAGWVKSFDQMFEKQNAKKRQATATGGAATGAPSGGGSTPRLTFSNGQSLSAKQVLENFNATAASLPANSATFSTSSPNVPITLAKAGANIMAGSSGAGAGGPRASSGGPAADSLRDMMNLMQKSGVMMTPAAAGAPQAGAGGSQSARTLSDSDSRSSLLTRDASGGRSVAFTERLVGELRTALHAASTTAAERQNEVARLKQEVRLALQDANEAATREGALIQRVHLLATQTQALETNLRQAQTASTRAECIAASLERQLRRSLEELDARRDSSSPSGGGGGGSSSSNAQPPRSIDYQLHSDLEPSPVLRSVLFSSQAPPRSGTASSAIAIAADATEEKSMARHGRTSRVGVGLGGRGVAQQSVRTLSSSPSDSPPSSSRPSASLLHSTASVATTLSLTSDSRRSLAQPSFASSTALLDLPSPGSTSTSNQHSFDTLPITVKPAAAATGQA